MRSVGHELALRAKGGAQPRQQPVERARQLADFVCTILTAKVLGAGDRQVRRLARHVGERPQPDGGEPEPAGRGEQEHDRNPDEHRLLHLVLFARYVCERRRDQEPYIVAIECFAPDVNAPRAGWRLNRRGRVAVGTKQAVRKGQAVPRRRERAAFCVEHRHGAAGNGHRSPRFLGASAPPWLPHLFPHGLDS